MSSYFDGKQLFMEPTVEQYSNHMVMTNVHKDEKKSYLNLDTAFSLNTDLINEIKHYDFKLPSPINDIKSMKLISSTIPLSYFNISNSLDNSYFKLTNITDNTSEVIKLKNNEYTEQTLIDGVAGILEGLNTLLPTNLSISRQLYNTQSGVSTISIVNNTGKDYKIDFDVDMNGSKDKYNFRSKLGYALGFRKTEYTINNSEIIVAEKLMDIEKRYNIYLTLDDHTIGHSSNYLPCNFFNNKNTVLAQISTNPGVDQEGHDADDSLSTLKEHKSRVNSNLEDGSIVSATRNYSGKTSIQRIRISFSDKFGNNIDFNGLDLNLTLELTHL